MRFSICIPYHTTPQTAFFLTRLLKSISEQTFTDYEIILTKEGMMAENTNAAMNKAQGELIKIMYMDDYFAHSHALQEINDNFGSTDTWLATGCLHQRVDNDYEDPHSPHYPTYNDKIHTGNNTIGSPSVITIRNEGHLSFDHHLSWLLDCDLYKRYYDTFGAPKLLNDLNVVLGIGEHQTTHKLSPHFKANEHTYLTKKFK